MAATANRLVVAAVLAAALVVGFATRDVHPGVDTAPPPPSSSGEHSSHHLTAGGIAGIAAAAVVVVVGGGLLLCCFCCHSAVEPPAQPVRRADIVVRMPPVAVRA
jgi:hypothetical protein